MKRSQCYSPIARSTGQKNCKISYIDGGFDVIGFTEIAFAELDLFVQINTLNQAISTKGKRLDH